MIPKEARLSILNEILNSQEFCKSDSYKKLLTYLVNASINGESPKEYAIAIEVFGKDASFNPGDDSTVRVYVGNLRKKLATYYQTEGKKAKIRLEIPKGHHEVRFVHSSRKPIRNFITSAHFLQLAIIAILLLTLVFTQLKVRSLSKYVNWHHLKIKNSPIWAEFFESKRPKLIVMGDDFFFLERVDHDQTIVRKHNINSFEEFEAYERSHRDRIIEGKTPYSFLPMISVQPLPQIMQIFDSDLKISLHYSSGLQSKDLLENDIIFLGSFRNLYLLNKLFRDGVFSFTLGPDTSFITVKTPDSLMTFVRSGYPQDEHTDFCLVRKIPGPNHNTIILFVSFFEAGLAGAVEQLTNPESLAALDQAFERRLKKKPRYFDILFKTSGYSRTAFTTRIEYIDEIDPNINIW